MESSDNTTPPRQPAGRPSLLNSGGRDAAETGTTRMLSSLERGDRPAAPPAAGGARPRNKYGIAVLAVLLLGVVGAVFTFQPFGDASSGIATAAAPRVPAVPPASDAGVALALASAASSAAAEAVAPAASAQIELASVSALPGTAPSAEAASAPRADGNPLDKLALNDAETAHAAALAASGAKIAAKPGPPAKPRPKPAVAKSPGAGETKAAAVRKAKRSEDDADTELVAAMIDRLDRRGPKSLAPAAPLAAPKLGDAVPANLAELVRDCSSKTDLLEARQCRNRVCDKYWGKADACPASRAPKTSSADEALTHERRA